MREELSSTSERDYDSEIRLIAANVMTNGFTWMDDGPKILQIIDLLWKQMHEQWSRTIAEWTPLEKYQLILRTILQLDEAYGWDAPNMSESTEDSMLTWMTMKAVGQLVANGRIGV